jgi:hypothetical protein
MILAAGDVRTASLTMIEASPPSAPLRFPGAQESIPVPCENGCCAAGLWSSRKHRSLHNRQFDAIADHLEAVRSQAVPGVADLHPSAPWPLDTDLDPVAWLRNSPIGTQDCESSRAGG